MAHEEESKRLERRRLQAGRWLLKGVSKSEVARRTGVSATAVGKWALRLEQGGVDALKRQRARGRPAGLDTLQRARLTEWLKAGALAAGFATELWTLPRIGRVIEQRLGRRYSASQVSRILKQLNFSCQRPTGRALQRDEQAILKWKRKRWPRLKKTPQ